jgi:hypothetical protein
MWNPKWPTWLESPAEKEYRLAREAIKAEELAKNPKPKLRKDLIYGVPPGHDSTHRPKSFDEIKGSILDGDGAFIYLIIDITNEENGRTKTIVRGYKDLMHLQILEKFQLEECEDIPWDDEVEHWHVACRAGGRIRHVDDEEEKKMYLYGYFISASHEEAVSIIEKDYKNYEF